MLKLKFCSIVKLREESANSLLLEMPGEKKLYSNI